MPPDQAAVDPGESVIRSVLAVPEVHDVVADWSEVGLDALVDNPAIEAIPVVRSLRALVRGAIGLREALFTKKILALLYGVGDADSQDVERWRALLDKEGGGPELGERVLALVDRVASTKKARLIGELLRAYLDGRCDRATFLRTAEMIDTALTEDLAFLVEWAEGAEDPASQRLLSVGLMVDRSSAILLENSELPAPSAEGKLLREVQSERGGS